MRPMSGSNAYHLGRAPTADLTQKGKLKIERQGPVLTICLSSQETRNSLDAQMLEELGDAVAQAEANKSVRAVFLTAQGPAFCSGANIKHMSQGTDPWQVHRNARGLGRTLMPLMWLDKPVVVGVTNPEITRP